MRLPRLVTIVVILLAPVLVSCTSATVTPTAQDVAPHRETAPRLIAPEAEILPGECLGFELAPVGTPEANPKLLLHVAPRDESTRKPITAPVTVLLGGRVLGHWPEGIHI